MLPRWRAQALWAQRPDFRIFFIEGYQQFSQELRIQSTTTRFLEYMVGAYFMHNQLELDSVAGFYFAPFGARIPQLNASSRVAVKINNKQTENSFSIFGAVTFNIAERFRVNIGSRYSNVDKSGNRAVQLGTAGASPSLSSFTAGTDLQQAVIASILSIPTGNYAETRRNDQKFMPSASVQFDITDDTMVYASYANGFKAGGYGFYLSGATFDPETVNAYEAGVKTDLFDRRLSINVAAFYSKFSDLQESINVNVPGAGTINVVENAAKSTVKGLEFTTVIRPSDALTISADLGYLSSKYNDYVGAPCASLQNLRPGCTQDLSGITRAFAPKWSGNIGLSYIVPLKNDNLAIAVSPLLYFSSKYFQQATADPLLEQDGFYKLDLTVSVGRRDDRWNVSIVGSNLTDRRTGSFRAVLPGSPGSSQVLPDPQRRIALRLAVKL